ncbi:SRPBCC family protein [Dehalogenimonas sp. THU2]|uniref:SRPBCC family protein n=1 Tax=Dehalogenimonas sp. THU2 TaxID=3151121 RepID=UPI0032184CF6
MGTKTIMQLAVFESQARPVYEALTDSRRHAAFTGEAAVIDARPGGTFTAYGDYITGCFVQIVPLKKIVQRWRAADWPEGVFSEVTIELQEKKGVTTLYFTQEGVPEDFAEAIAQGWHDHYWDRLRDYLENHPG